jgi:hypothetical protein
MKAITIKQPWAFLIVEGVKDIENRTWKTNFRGRVLIHASKTPAKIHFAVSGQATAHEILLSSTLNKAEEEGLFGCGGTSTGIHMADANATVVACVNHDRVAIATHAANHPDTIHFTEDIPAAKRFLSIEPLLGFVDLENLKGNSGSVYQVLESITNCGDANRPAIDWVIVGGETGPKARPMHPDWVRNIQQQCDKAEVPFFFKSWGEWMPTNRPLTSSEIAVIPKYYAMNNKFLQTVDGGEFYKLGKKKSGNKLDGRVYQEFPIN